MKYAINTSNDYDEKVDIWALDIIEYKTLYEKFPYEMLNGTTLLSYEQIIKIKNTFMKFFQKQSVHPLLITMEKIILITTLYVQ